VKKNLLYRKSKNRGYRLLLLFHLAIILGKSTLSAQDIQRADTLNCKYSLLMSPKQHVIELFGNTKQIIISPFQKWDNRKWITSSLFIGGSLLSYFTLDKPIHSLLKNEQSQAWRNFNTGFSNIGEPLIIGSFIVGLELMGHISKNNKFNKVAVLSAHSLFISLSSCYGAKVLSGRARPTVSDRPDLWYGPTWNDDSKRSFFSGHTTALFTLTTVIAMEFEHVKWLPPTLYSIAGLSSISRIASDEHWTSDVVFAALFAHVVARALVNRERNKNKKYSLIPTISPFTSQAGIAILF